MSLNLLIARGALWAMVERGGQQALSFLIFLVIARLTTPQDFGLASICFISFSLAAFVFSALADGVVRLQIQDKKVLSSLQWACVGVGLMLSLLSIVSAPVLARVFGDDAVTGVMLVFSVIPFVQGCVAVPNAMLSRDINFRAHAVRTLVATAVSGLGGIYLAYEGWGAYAYVIQQVMQNVMGAVVVFVAVRWRPTLRMSKADLRMALAPAGNLLKIYSVNFIDGQLPRVIIGAALGVSAVGVYALAARLTFAVTEILVSPVLSALYPGLARINDDDRAFRNLIGRVLRVGYCAYALVVAIGVALAPVVIPLLFSKKWVAAIGLFQIYMAGSIVVPFLLLSQQIFRLKSQGSILLKINIAQGGINAALLFLLMAGFSLYEMSAVQVGLSLAYVPVAVMLFRRTTGLDLSNDMLTAARSTVGAAVVCVGVVTLLAYTTGWNNLLRCVVSGGMGVLGYGLFVRWFQPRLAREIYGMVLTRLPRR